MSRWKAATIHSTISAAIALLIGRCCSAYGIRHPISAGGADELVLLLVGVDLAIGPLLTLIVFRTGKKGLRFDLVTISLLQTVALIYGMSVILRSRPIFLVGEPDRFVLVAANEVKDEDLAQGREPAFRSRSWTGPRLVAAELPTDVKERNNLAFGSLAGRDIENLPKYYRDYAESGKSLLKKAKPLGVLLDTDPKRAPAIDRRYDQHQPRRYCVGSPSAQSDLVMLLDGQ